MIQYTAARIAMRGFTLVELLVVIAIIGLLAGVITVSVSGARAKAGDTKRKADLRQLQNALELYYDDHGAYPTTTVTWWGMSTDGGSRPRTGPTGYIPNLAPTYIAELPADPSGQTAGWSGYLYISNGQSYKLLSHIQGPETFPAPTEPFYDPIRPTWAFMVCTGAACAW